MPGKWWFLPPLWLLFFSCILYFCKKEADLEQIVFANTSHKVYSKCQRLYTVDRKYSLCVRPSEKPQCCDRGLIKGQELGSICKHYLRQACRGNSEWWPCFPGCHCVAALRCLWVLWRLLRLSDCLLKSLPVTWCDLMALEAVGHRADLSPSCPPLSSPWIFSWRSPSEGAESSVTKLSTETVTAYACESLSTAKELFTLMSVRDRKLQPAAG